jgi:hypothetical protein
MFASTWSATTGWGATANQSWTTNVPSTALLIVSRAGAASTVYFVDQGGGQGYWTFSSAYMRVGVARGSGAPGVPGGLIHEAYAHSTGGGTQFDEKRAYNESYGTYHIYHGGGGTNANNASVYGYSEINW